MTFISETRFNELFDTAVKPYAAELTTARHRLLRLIPSQKAEIKETTKRINDEIGLHMDALQRVRGVKPCHTEKHEPYMPSTDQLNELPELREILLPLQSPADELKQSLSEFKNIIVRQQWYEHASDLRDAERVVEGFRLWVQHLVRNR